jgi:hypothetical protein
VGRWTLHDSECRCAIIVLFPQYRSGRIASDKGVVQGRNSIRGRVSEHRAGMDLPFSPVLIESQKRQNVPVKFNVTAEERHGRGDCHDQG